MLCTGVSSHIDDEYKWAGVEDPKIMVTTSRDPSSRLKMFAKVSTLQAPLLLKHFVKIKRPQLCSRETKMSITQSSYIP